MSTEPRIWTFKALTPLWTGDANGKSGRLIPTGFLGSIRWWFEVVVRGLGARPCDPSNTTCIEHKHCVVCELFGCTGWARKFRFDVLDKDGAAQQEQIEKDNIFQLRFTPLRAIRDEEWALLDLTLRLIAEHGAIGGKTVFKPTDEPRRISDKIVHHHDFGLIKLVTAPDGATSTNKAELETYARDSRWHNAPQNGLAWASLTNFWSVPGHCLARQDANSSTFNQILGRGEPKNKACNGDSWLAGRRAGNGRHGESKKVSSFKSPARTYGFVNPDGQQESITLNDIKTRLGKAWLRTVVEEEVAEGDTARIQLMTGGVILERLLPAPKETS